MEQSTKQRIVGTIALLALALIILPIIFDGEGSPPPQPGSRIPNPPQIPVLEEQLQSRPVILAENDAPTADAGTVPATDAGTTPVADASTASAPPPALASEAGVAAATDQSADASDTETDTETNTAVEDSVPAFSRQVPELNEAGLPTGWSVRLGVFCQTANADRLVEQLQAAGYTAYLRQLEQCRGVYVGPFVDSGRAEGYKARLLDEFQLGDELLVVRYERERL
ncbi:MAG: SPOR domain-containing protein [Pseudohongiellaceae bacterium]